MDVLSLIDKDIWGIYPFFHTAHRMLNKAEGHDIKVDLVDYEDYFNIKFSLPGVPSDHITVTFDTAKLTFTVVVAQLAERPHAPPANFHFRERPCFSTTRNMHLKHGSVKPESVVAKTNDGLLVINVEKVAGTEQDNSHVFDVKVTR